MKSTVYLQTRGAVESLYSEGADEQPFMTPRGEQLISEFLPRYTTLAASGCCYQVRATTAAAPVVAIPSTACLLGLWNGEPDNGKSYVILAVNVIRTASSAAFQEVSILVNCSIQRITTAIANTLTPRPLGCNRVGYGGNARVAVGITLAAADGGVATNWHPAAYTSNQIASGAANIGGSMTVDVFGRYIIPPKCQFSMTAISSVATASSVLLGVRWAEVVIPPVV